MYWIPKMHKNPTSACFIIASKICSTKQSSDRIITSFQFFKSFKLLSNINKKIVQNLFQHMLFQNYAITNQNVKFHPLLISLLDEGPKTFTRFLVQHTGRTKQKGNFFIETTLKTAINHLIGNCYSNVGNMTMKQSSGIPMGIDHAPF